LASRTEKNQTRRNVDGKGLDQGSCNAFKSVYRKPALAPQQLHPYYDGIKHHLKISSLSWTASMPKFEVPAVDGLSQAELNKATIRFNSTASGITGVVEDLRNEIRKIEDAIKADEDGEFEYEKVLGNLRNEKEDIKKRIAGCESYLQTFEDGPGAVIEKTYVDNTKAVKNLYNDARIGHQRGIEMLIQDFDYHPAFKQRDDAFSSVPFNPKRI
jgi:hypothetical protein